jgi:hypothetical protein
MTSRQGCAVCLPVGTMLGGWRHEAGVDRSSFGRSGGGVRPNFLYEIKATRCRGSRAAGPGAGCYVAAPLTNLRLWPRRKTWPGDRHPSNDPDAGSSAAQMVAVMPPAGAAIACSVPCRRTARGG